MRKQKPLEKRKIVKANNKITSNQSVANVFMIAVKQTTNTDQCSQIIGCKKGA